MYSVKFVLMQHGVVPFGQEINCVWCLDEVESVDHLLLHCPRSFDICTSLFKWWNILWILPSSLANFTSDWNIGMGINEERGEMSVSAVEQDRVWKKILKKKGLSLDTPLSTEDDGGKKKRLRKIFDAEYEMEKWMKKAAEDQEKKKNKKKKKKKKKNKKKSEEEMAIEKRKRHGDDDEDNKRKRKKKSSPLRHLYVAKRFGRNFFLSRYSI
ncbi:hypothetical protein Tco_0474123 [Tanacetum coccineum]